MPNSVDMLTAISPLDGRYANQTAPLSRYFSEFALIAYRVRVETEWLIALSRESSIPEVRAFTETETTFLTALNDNFTTADALRIKEIERTTNHDVKAVEYFLRERLQDTTLADVREWVHFACTSEDINNLAHAQMLRDGMQIWLDLAEEVVSVVGILAHQQSDQPMLSRTHGQHATPTTLGKEMAVFASRWRRQIKQIAAQEFLGKMNGAVGAFNAHAIAYPDAPWQSIAERFVTGLGLTYNPLTTQIESHDYIAELFHALSRFNTITLDFARDIWAYISLGYFRQRVIAGEVGSSTMPHKVNPIDFENAEANLGLSNALLEHLAAKLPVSRLQRDLSDSSALRSMGSGIMHSYLALLSLQRGLKKLTVDTTALNSDLDQSWEVLGEAIQTVLRKQGHANAYEQLKDLTRGTAITAETIHQFVETLDLPETDKARLLQLTPQTYIGLAPQLARDL